MNTINNADDSFRLDLAFIILLLISLFLLTTITLEGSFGPIVLYMLMIVMGMVLIAVFSNSDEIFLKIKLFIFFFSLYLIYVLIYHYILLNFLPERMPVVYKDEKVFFYFSSLGLPYVSGERNFFNLFSVFQIHELPLHVVFSSSIAYFSILIDGSSGILVQKLLSPFFGGMFSVVLYSTLKHVFKDTAFALKATFMYSFLSAIFMFSTPLLRDIDVALFYIVFIYLFLQADSMKNFILLLFVSFATVYLRSESGFVLIGLSLIYSYLIIRKLKNRSSRAILYMIVILIFALLISLIINKVIGMIVSLDEAKTARGIATSSKDSISLIFNKLPFGLSQTAKVFFGQMQPFPFFIAIDRPPETISGIFWPFIFITMLYALTQKNIMALIDIKIKYLLVVAIAVLYLMSSEPMARRMMSVYPVIYIVSLYVFMTVPKNKIKKMIYYYLFGMLVLNTFYYLLKIKQFT
jgi:hypothetical protein